MAKLRIRDPDQNTPAWEACGDHEGPWPNYEPGTRHIMCWSSHGRPRRERGDNSPNYGFGNRRRTHRFGMEDHRRNSETMVQTTDAEFGMAHTGLAMDDHRGNPKTMVQITDSEPSIIRTGLAMGDHRGNLATTVQTAGWKLGIIYAGLGNAMKNSRTS